MNPRVSFFLIGCLSSFVWASAAAQTAINGHINGVEYCFQSIPGCGQAEFIGTFTGTINGNDTTAVFIAKVSHADLNYTSPPYVTAVTGGEWSLYNLDTTIKGTVANGGTLKYHKNNNTFTVDLTLPIEGGSSTAMFDGTLNHNVFPPTVTGRLRSK